MKVIFNDKFTESIIELGNTIEITNYIVGSYYKEVSSTTELFDKDYLENDKEKLNSKVLTSIWNEETNLLNMSIEGFDYISSNFNQIIYVFYNQLGSLNSDIAFIISGDITKNIISKNYEISSLEFSKGNNLINLTIPSIKCNIITQKNSDLTFLEGLGISNARPLDAQNSTDTTLITKSSYLNSLNNSAESLNKFSVLSYLDQFGENKHNLIKFRRYISISLRALNTLEIIQGYQVIQYVYEISYQDYEYYDSSYYNLIDEGTVSGIYQPIGGTLELDIIADGASVIQIDSNNIRAIFEVNSNNPNINSSISLTYYDIIDKTFITITDKLVRVYDKIELLTDEEIDPTSQEDQEIQIKCRYFYSDFKFSPTEGYLLIESGHFEKLDNSIYETNLFTEYYELGPTISIDQSRLMLLYNSDGVHNSDVYLGAELQYTNPITGENDIVKTKDGLRVRLKE